MSGSSDSDRGRRESFSDRMATDPSVPSGADRDGGFERDIETALDEPAPSVSSKSAAGGSKSGPRQKTALERIAQKKPTSKTEMESANSPDTHPPDPKADEHVGKIFGGKYRIDRLVAKGGMGRVYRGTQFPLERPVAIKILNKEFQRSDPQFVRRFFLEASTAAKLSHPHSITVFDYGESDTGDLFIAMEYLKGRPLSRVISADGPFSSERALRISMQICRALREAHFLGIIHRDLKPGNIFLVDEGDDSDYAKVLDFGLVKLFKPEAGDDGEQPHEGGGMLGDNDGDLTRTGTLLGSPKYMSPEQIQGHVLDPRTDIYSFGIILFQMVAGKPPFTGATGVDVIYKHVHEPIPSVSSIAPGVEIPAPVEALIRRCLAKSRDERYASMDELIIFLKDALRLVTGTSTSGDSMAEVVGAARMALQNAPTARTDPMPVKEAGFRDPLVEDPTPMGQLGGDRAGEASGPAPRPSKMPLAVSALGFVVALVTLAYVTVIGPNLKHAAEQSAQPSPLAAQKEAQVRFTSDPAGAEVLEGDKSLGTTPFARSFAIGSADAPHQFTFKHAGYKDALKTVLVSAETAQVDAALEPAPAPQEEAEVQAAEGDAADEAEDRGGTHDAKKLGAKKKRAAAGGAPKAAGKKDSQYRRNPY